MQHKSTKIIAAISITFFLISVLVFAVFWTLLGKQKLMFDEAYNGRIEQHTHQKSLEALMQTLDETREARESLFTRVLSEEGVIDFLARIESLGRELSVTLNTDSLTTAPINEKFETLIVKVSVRGSYDAVAHSMKLFEQLPYHVYISSVALTREESGLWSGVYELRVTKFKKT